MINSLKQTLGIDLTTEEQLKEFLMDGVKEKAKSDSKKRKEIKKANIEQETKIKVAKNKKKQFEALYFQSYPNKIAQAMMTEWTNLNKINKDEELQKNKTAYNEKEKSIKDACNTTISSVIVSVMDSYDEYYRVLVTLEPSGKHQSFGELMESINQMGQNIFDDLKKQALEMAEKIKKQQIEAIEKMKKLQNIQFSNEKALQKIGEIPLKIEDTIQEVKDILDTLLGKYLGKLDPNNVDFDIEILIAKIKGIVDPLMSSIAPLESLVGKVPIIGEIASILSIIQGASSTSGPLTKEEIKKLIPQKPEIPGKIVNCIRGIIEDISVVAQQLPMIMINILFQMIGVIIGMFEQILGVLGVPSIPYPLSLLPQCITSWDLIKLFIWHIPSLLQALIEGAIKDKLAEAMALSIPKPNLDFDIISTLCPKPELDKSSPKSKPETKNKDYIDVVSEAHKKLNSIDKRFSRSDVQRILKSYQDINNGSKETINFYESFSEVKKDETNDKGEKIGEKTSYIPNKSSIQRIKPTPDEAEKEINNAINNRDKDNNIKYKKIKKTSSVVGGGVYEKYKQYITEKEPNTEVVITDTIEPKTFGV